MMPSANRRPEWTALTPWRISYGYIRDFPVERWHRDSKIYTLFEGTSEIQRLVVARAVSGLHIP
jgi:alkylation response protein AidB-like acyl-CoA dehydrogenase